MPRRDRFIIIACIALVTALAWLYLIRLGRRMSADMRQNELMAAMRMAVNVPWTAADVFFTFSMWAVMMVGMMAPAATPMLLLFAAAQGKRSGRPASLTTALFGLGYFGVWVGFSAGAALAQWVLHERAMLSAAMAATSPRLAGAVLLAAGAYQLTPWKGRCLAHCRGPLGFLMAHWREGKLGAFQMGSLHGAYCLGCCWALMGLLFVVGVMNLVWVAALAAFVLLEKVGPQGALVARVSGVALVVLGIMVIV